MNIRLFKAVGGREPEGDAKRMAFIKVLPPDVRARVTFHQDMPQYQDFVDLKRFALKYIKVMLGLNAERRMRSQPVRLVQDDQGCDDDEDEQGDLQDAVHAGEDSVEILEFGAMDAEAKVEILAFMRGWWFITRASPSH